MLDITQIKGVTMTRIFFKNDTHISMNANNAKEMYDITEHLIHAIPIIESISNEVHNIPFKEYKEKETTKLFETIDIEIHNKYARIENENIAGKRQECREILEMFRKFKYINHTCKEYLHNIGFEI